VLLMSIVWKGIVIAGGFRSLFEICSAEGRMQMAK